MPEIIKALGHLVKLHTLKLAHNNLRGDNGGHIVKLISFLPEMSSLKSLDLSENILGKNYGRQLDKKPPPICLLADVMIKTVTIENLNMAHNEINPKGVLAVAFGLAYTNTLKEVSL